MRIKVNPKENSLTDDKMKGGGGVAENHMIRVHSCALLLQLFGLSVRDLSLGSDGFHLGRQTRHFA